MSERLLVGSMTRIVLVVIVVEGVFLQVAVGGGTIRIRQTRGIDNVVDVSCIVGGSVSIAL